MSGLNTDRHDALTAARVDEGLARRATSRVMDQPSALRRIDAELADIRTTRELHGWMLTPSLGLSVAILARLLFIPLFG